MNPWQHGKKARERSPLARVVGRRPLGRPRRSGSSQLVVAVENNKRGRREPPAFFSYHQSCVDSIEEPGSSGCPWCLARRFLLGRWSPHVRPERRGRLIALAVRDDDADRLDTHLIIVVVSVILCGHRSPLVDSPPALVRGALCRKAPHVPPSACAVNTRSDNELHKKRLPRPGAQRRGMTRLVDRSSCPNATRPLYGRRRSRPCCLNPRCRAQP